MAHASRFWNLIAKHYAKKPVPDESLYQNKLDRTRAQLTPDMNVLEFGCGTGTTALHLAPSVARYHGIDTSKKMIVIANNKKAHAGQPNLHFSCHSIETQLDGNERYDAILAMSILHLLDNPMDVLQKLSQHLRPNGLLISSTVCAKDAMPAFRFLSPLMSMIGLPRVTSFSEKELESIINQFGFKTMEKISATNSTEACFLISQKLN